MPRLRPVYFDSGKPSNFYIATITMWCPLVDTYIDYPANEYYFHCAKTFGCAAPGMLKMHNDILAAHSCREAKALGHKVPLSTNEIAMWDARVAIEAMLACNLAKYQRHEECREWLLNTGDRPLVEHRRDKIWGDNLDGSGMNLLGKILELVRARVRGLNHEIQQQPRPRAVTRRSGRR